MAEFAIEIKGLGRRFGKTVAVDNLSLNVPQGSVFGFLGRNGAGKTTTIQMLMNLLKPSEGHAKVLGCDPIKDELQLKQRIGYVSDNPAFYDWMTVDELVWFNGKLYTNWDHGKANSLLDRFALDTGQKVKALSRGMKAQLALTLALGHNPELLILDEPSSGLDVVVRRDFLESIISVIQEEGRTVFISSHLVHEVERVADRVAVIDQGKLRIEGDVDDVKARVKQVRVRVTEGGDVRQLPGVVKVQGDAPNQMLTVVDFEAETTARFNAQGIEVVDVVDQSLEDCFVAYVGT